MGVDTLVVLAVVLILVLIWRGPKTLPLLGRAFGQGVKEARKEMEDLKSDSSTTDKPEDGKPTS
jgi:Sec-independent protein translocase protein TatA